MVAKGGNFLINRGGCPDGWFHLVAVNRLEDIGKWLAVNTSSAMRANPPPQGANNRAGPKLSIK